MASRLKKNPFAALKDLDPSEPDFVFAPSILAGNGGGGGGVSFSSSSPSSSSFSNATPASASASSGPLPGAGRPSGSGAPSWQANASIDLQGVADELQRSLAGPGGSDGSGAVPSGLTAHPFDFSAFTSVTAQTELQIAQAAQAAQAAAAAARQRAVDEHLAKAHERDKAEDLFRFGGRGGGDMSRGARQRKAEAAERREAHEERLGAKVMKRAATQKRMNQVKNLYK
jgi:hypothetical protein